MDPLAQNPAAFYIVLGLIALWRLPVWGQRILAFLRDLLAFLAESRERQ